MIPDKMHEQIQPLSQARRVLKILIAISVVAVIAHIALKYLSVVVHGEQHLALFEISNRFDMNDENSVPQWITLMNFLILAAASFLAGFMTKQKAKKRLWMAIGILSVLLSIDDAAAIHESLLGLIHLSVFEEGSSSLLENAWLFIVPVVAVIGIWLLVHAVRLLPRRTALLLAVGGVTFLIGAILVDSLANTVAERSFAGQGVVAGIEGWLQMVGLAMLVYAVLDYLERQHAPAIQKAFRALKDGKS